MLRTYPAFIPCSATTQNWFPIRPSPTGVRRGFPVFRPFVSSNAYPGSGQPRRKRELDWRVEEIFLKRVNDPMFHFSVHGRKQSNLSSLGCLSSAFEARRIMDSKLGEW